MIHCDVFATTSNKEYNKKANTCTSTNQKQEIKQHIHVDQMRNVSFYDILATVSPKKKKKKYILHFCNYSTSSLELNNVQFAGHPR